MSKARSIFRYPGGKFKAIRFIRPFWEQVMHDEYREPFVGGGSIFIAKPLVKYNWINDINDQLIAFYKVIQDKNDREKLIKKLLTLKISRELYDKLYFSKPKTFLQKAERYYVLNRCSFSGITKWNAFIGDVRYNINNTQDLIRHVGDKLTKIKITNLDFEKIISTKPKGREEVFIFLDPPYAESRQIAAYDYAFLPEDHIRLHNLLKKTRYKFLLTYDNCDFIKKLYKWAYQYEDFTWTYSLANSRVHHNPREIGNELFISNFDLKKIQRKLFND